MKVGTILFRTVGLIYEEVKVLVVEPNRFVLQNQVTGEEKTTTNLTQNYYYSERVALTEYAERLRKELQIVNGKLNKKFNDFLEKEIE